MLRLAMRIHVHTYSTNGKKHGRQTGVESSDYTVWTDTAKDGERILREMSNSTECLRLSVVVIIIVII